MNDSFPGEDLHRQLTAEQQSHFIADYALKRKRQTAGNLVSAAVILLCVIAFGVAAGSRTSAHLASLLVPLGVGLSTLLANAIFQLINLRCPRCNQGQAKTSRARYCHNCGIRLRKDKQPKR